MAEKSQRNSAGISARLRVAGLAAFDMGVAVERAAAQSAAAMAWVLFMAWHASAPSPADRSKMKDPRPFRRRARLALAGIAASIAGAAAALFHAERMPAWLGVGLAFVALVACFFVFIPTAIMDTYEARRRERLARGEGVLARWTVDADTWRRTGERCLLAGTGRDALRNSITAYDAPPEGVEVAVLENALFVGDVLHGLEPSHGLTVTVEDGWIGFEAWHQEGDNWMLRVPIARGAEADAQRAAAHFQALMAARG